MNRKWHYKGVIFGKDDYNRIETFKNHHSELNIKISGFIQKQQNEGVLKEKNS